MRRTLVWIAIVLCSSCGGTPPPSRTATPPRPRAQAPAPKPETPRSRLARDLRSIPRPRRVLDALGARAKRDVEAMVRALSADERAALASGNGPWPRARPLLHLAAGGDSADAYYELATSGRAGDELIAARRHAGSADVADLVESTRAVARSAAARWLRDRAVEASSPTRATSALCDKLDRAGAALERNSTRRRARELAAELEPTALQHARVARAALWDLDLEAARSALARARAAARSDADRTVVASVERDSKLAEGAVASRGKALELDQAVQVGRAFLRLGRTRDAREVIAPHAAAADKHLAVATLHALSSTEHVACPGLGASAGNPMLCAVAWSSNAQVAEARRLVETAWKARAGRDEEAVGAYLGLAHFVPWIYGTYLAGGTSAPAAEAFLERLGRVRSALDGAVSTAPAFEGVRLFVDTLAALYQAAREKKADQRVHLPVPEQDALERRARELAQKLPDHRLTHAAILAVATALTQERDISSLLALLPEQLEPSYQLPREVLRLWVAVEARDAAGVDRASGAIAALFPKDVPAIANAKLVLLMAEARAATLGTPRELDVLERVASQLVSEDVSLEVRLRAATDRAGALARQGKRREAESALEGVVGTARPAAGSTENDVFAVAFGYLLVLRALGAQGDERQEYRDKLAKLPEQLGQLPQSVLAWQKLWLAEIDRRLAEDRCGTMKACREKARRAPPLDQAELVRRLGQTSAKILRSGTLAAGSLNLNFAFSAEEGLEPIVVFDPRLLAVEIPPQPGR